MSIYLSDFLNQIEEPNPHKELLHPFTTDVSCYPHIEEIADKMKEVCDHDFVNSVLLMAKEYEGTYDLMCLWVEEPEHQEEIIEVLKEESKSY